jgi:hypothetical protein
MPKSISSIGPYMKECTHGSGSRQRLLARARAYKIYQRAWASISSKIELLALQLGFETMQYVFRAIIYCSFFYSYSMKYHFPGKRTSPVTSYARDIPRIFSHRILAACRSHVG